MALPGGYTYVVVVVFGRKKHSRLIIGISRIYPDQLAALSGLTAFPIATQPQAGLRYITGPTPHGLTATGQPTGTYTIGYDDNNYFIHE